MMLLVRWCEGWTISVRTSSGRTGHRRLIFTYPDPRSWPLGTVLLAGRRARMQACGGTLTIDMKRGHHRHVHVIIAQGDLPVE